MGDFEKEFEYTDYVIISAGVNDVSRYERSAYYISILKCNKLRYWVQKYPNTVFVFNSILSVHTKFAWLNTRINYVNKELFELSLELYDHSNFYFLDTHAKLQGSKIQHVISSTGNGVHITQKAASIVQSCILECVVGLDRYDQSLYQVWPLRHEYRRSASAFHSRRSWNMTGSVRFG